MSFDRSVIKKNWRAINESPAKRAGLTVRKAAIRSIRKARLGAGTKRDPTGRKTFQKPSRPGKPPKSRARGHPLRMIYSVPHAMGTGAMVGPVGFGGNPPVPEIHEKGKSAVRMFGRRRRRGQRFRRRIRRQVRYPARPFMVPAMERVAPKFPPLWRHSLSA